MLTKKTISMELLSELGYGEVTYIGDIAELYEMQCLTFKCNITSDSGRNDGKTIITSKAYHIALEVIAHKCKVWAITKDCYLQITIKAVKICEETSPYYHIEILDEYNYGRQSIREARLSEPEAIFKACQWILENK